MKFKLNGLLYVIIVFIAIHNDALFAQTSKSDPKDNQGWFGAKLKLDLPSGWETNVDFQTRFINNLQLYNGSYSSVGVTKKINKVVELQSDYRLALVQKGTYHRISFGGEATKEIDRFKLGLRLLIQNQLQDFEDELKENQKEGYWRARFETNYAPTDHIDLYQMHRFDYETPLEESLGAFDDLIRAGKVHYIGFSEWNAEQIKSALAIQDARGYNRFVSSQPQYSALWRVIEAEVVPLSEKEGIGQIVWSPMAQGVLTGKYLPGKKAPAGSRATDKGSGANMIKGWLREEVLEAVQNLKPIAEQAGLSMSQLAIAWVLQNPNVSSAIMGATKPKQVKENVKASGVKLDAEIMKAIDSILGTLPERDPQKNQSPNPRA